MWAIISFDTNMDFCKGTYIIGFDGFNLELIKGSNTTVHSIYIETKSNISKAFEACLKFLSEMSWLYNTSVSDIFMFSASTKLRIGNEVKPFSRTGNVINLVDYEQLSLDSTQRLALGLYKEGISSNSNFYKFLSFFKILNLNNHKGKEQIKWINNKTGELKLAKKALNELITSGVKDIGDYLYSSGRCAIAHASIKSGEPIANPDNYEDLTRINNTIGIIEELASIYINKDLKIPNRFEAFRIKAVKMFKKILGEELSEKVQQKATIDNSSFPQLPRTAFRILNQKRPLESFEGLQLNIVSIGEGVITASNRSQDWPIKLEITIDLLKNEVKFDINKLKLDSAHKDYNDELRLEYHYFLKDYFLNGRLEIWDLANNTLITRLLPFIPTNIDLHRTIQNFEGAINILETKLKDNL